VKFLVDNALSPKLAALLRESGHDAVHVREYGMQDERDPEILRRAAVEGRILVSADSDFAGLLALGSEHRTSFLLFREPDLVDAVEYRDLILACLRSMEAELAAGCIVVFRRGLLRIRTLPIL